MKPFAVRNKQTGEIYRRRDCHGANLSALAIRIAKEGQHIIWSDIETIAVGMDGKSLYLIDECGYFAWLESDQFEILEEADRETNAD